MGFISPIMFVNTLQWGAATASAGISTLVAGVVRDFFTQIFLNPGQNYIAVMILCGGVVVPLIGSAFLAHWAYNKYCNPAKI